MKIERVEARNFLTFGDPGILLEGIPQRTVIVGPNGAGKTNFLRAIEFVGDVFTGRIKTAQPFVHRYDTARIPSVRVDISLARDEIEVLADLLLASIKGDLRFGGKNDVDTNVAQRIARELLNRARPTFVELFSRKLQFCVRGREDQSDPLDYFVEMLGLPTPLFLTSNGLSTTSARAMGWGSVNLGEEVVQELEARQPGIIALGDKQKPVDEKDSDEFASSLNLDWFLTKMQPKGPYPVILSTFGFEIENYENRTGGSALDVLRLRTFLADAGYTLRGIGLRDLAGLVFQSSTVRLSDARSTPERTKIPPIYSIPIAASPVDGSTVPNVLYRLKNSVIPAERARFEELVEVYRRFTGHGINVVVESWPAQPESGPLPLFVLDGKVVTRSSPMPDPVQVASLRWSNEWIEFSSEAVAAGLLELLLPFLLVLGRTQSVILLDEPALNLHPVKQRDLLSLISEAATTLGNQVFIVSHSDAFVIPREALSLLRFSSATGETQVFRLGTLIESDSRRVIRDLERTPQLTRALFSEKVLLVEGGSEAAALPEWFRVLSDGVDLARSGVEVIDAGGQQSFDGFVRVLTAWGIPFRIIADQKAKEAVAEYASSAHLYPYDDFSELLEKECAPLVLEAALREVRSRNGLRAPAVAREVALNSPPPASIMAMWTQLTGFVRPVAPPSP